MHWPLFRFAQNFDVMRNSMLLRKNAKNKIEFLGKKTLKNKTLSCKFFSFIYLYPEKKKKIVFIFFNLCNKYTREYYCTRTILEFIYSTMLRSLNKLPLHVVSSVSPEYYILSLIHLYN